jgi:hypothetical protein
VLGVGTVASGVNHAQTTSQAVSTTCTGGGQLCNNIATINVTTTGLLQAQFVGSRSIGDTGFFNLQPVSAGSYVVGLQAEGQTGGCNVGTLGGWSGTASITINAPAVAAQSVPTLSPRGITLLLTLLGFLGLRHLRRSGPPRVR